jgi:hypothetical protein
MIHSIHFKLNACLKNRQWYSFIMDAKKRKEIFVAQVEQYQQQKI